jgi:hypothetical protein
MTSRRTLALIAGAAIVALSLLPAVVAGQEGTPTAAPQATGTAGPQATPTAGGAPGSGGGAVMAVSAPEGTVDKSFTVDVTIDGATNLGAYQFILRFDRDLISPADVQIGPFLASTGRETQCVRQEDRTPPDEVRYGCFSMGEQEGPNGSGLIATVQFDVEGDGQSPLELDQVRITDPDGTLQNVTSTNGTVTVEGGGGGAPWLIIGIVIAVVVVIAAAAGAFIVRRRGGGAPAGEA